MRSLKTSEAAADIFISDSDLAEKLKKGDDSALNEIMSRYKERLYKFAWRMVGNEDNARDIVQETFTKVYFNIKKFDSSYKFSTWLYQIALNSCRDYKRKNKYNLFNISLDHTEAKESELWLAPQSDMVDALHAKRQVAKLKTEIAKLPAKLRETFLLYAIEEKSQVECATILGVSVKAIETRVYRARKILEQVIGK